MKIEYEDDNLRLLAIDPNFTGGYDRTIVRSYRMRIQFIEAAADIRDFYGMKSLHFEKLQGKRKGQYSIRLNKQWRLILNFTDTTSGKTAIVISITDYH